MKQFLLLLGLLVLIAVGIVAYTGMGRRVWFGPGTNVVQTSDGVMFVIEHHDQRIVVALPKELENTLSRTTANSAAKTLDADIDFYASGGQPRVNIQFHSNAPYSIVIDDQSFGLTQGRVFFVKLDPNATGGFEVTQAPFDPLEPTLEYLTELKKERER
ncbi:MAG TPA: hypothetical protein VGJ26_05575, partial [Pirellulales bacterium]|jgi:hypothetical protein